jgi:signal transduction histidine kinase
MFYINSKIIRKKEVLFLHLIPTFIVFAAFLAITFFSWSTAKNSIKTEQITALEQNNNLLASHVSESVNNYEDLLRGAAGFIESSNSVTREEWKSYVAAYEVNERYSGIQAIGYVENVSQDRKEEFVASMRLSWDQSYDIFPPSSAAIQIPIVYVEPENEKNSVAPGFDMYSEPIRQAAMDEARDSGKAVVSDAITLIQDWQEPRPYAGFLVFLPVYERKSELVTVDDRRLQSKGFVYIAFRLDKLIDFLPDERDQYGFILKTEDMIEDVAYKSTEYDALVADPKAQQSTDEIVVLGKKWIIHGVVTPNIVSDSILTRPPNVLWGGLLFSLSVAGFIYLLLGNRARALADKEAKGIQDAKDELLALASHQLRTPATGVKQYVGMLREGFSGELDPSQRQLLDKAYESNERQLTTINEMLFVARADAGHLNVRKKHLDFTELLLGVLEEQQKTVSERRQKMTLQIPERHLFVDGDSQFLRMAVENIVNNAFKYTKKGGRVYIILTKSKKAIELIVKDTGVGVATADQPLLFQKFSRIPNALTNEVSGTGIGLYLARKLVEAHDGSVDFVSVEGEGSTVTITLPAAILGTGK